MAIVAPYERRGRSRAPASIPWPRPQRPGDRMAAVPTYGARVRRSIALRAVYVALGSLWICGSCGARSDIGGGAPGCASLDLAAPIFVKNALRLPSTTCEATSASDFLPSGALDVAYAQEYRASLLVCSQLSEVVEIQGVDAEALDSSGQALVGSDGMPAKVEQGLEVVLDAAGAQQPSCGVTEAVLLDAATVTNLAATGESGLIVVHLDVHGESASGEAVKSNPYDFPVEVCDGCLCFVPPEAHDPAGPPGNCDAKGGTPEESCRVGQDSPFDCRLVPNGCE